MTAPTAITPVIATFAGVLETRQLLDFANGMYLPSNDGKYLLRVEDTDAAVDVTVVITAQAKYGGLVLTSPSVAITHDAAYLKAKYIGPFDPTIFNDASGSVQIPALSYAGTASKLVISAIHLG